MVTKMETVVRMGGSIADTPTTIPTEVKNKARPMVKRTSAMSEI